MALSPQNLAEPTRNTLNQRASRARRKTYISDLERRVRDHEAQGIQATEQVQAAARLVSDQNRALREEVRALRERCALLERLLGDGKSNREVLQSRGTMGGLTSQPTVRKRKVVEDQYPSPPHDCCPQGALALAQGSSQIGGDSTRPASSTQRQAVPPVTPALELADSAFDPDPTFHRYQYENSGPEHVSSAIHAQAHRHPRLQDSTNAAQTQSPDDSMRRYGLSRPEHKHYSPATSSSTEADDMETEGVEEYNPTKKHDAEADFPLQNNNNESVVPLHDNNDAESHILENSTYDDDADDDDDDDHHHHHQQQHQHDHHGYNIDDDEIPTSASLSHHPDRIPSSYTPNAEYLTLNHPNSTSCAQAALIIASMRGFSSSSAAFDPDTGTEPEPDPQAIQVIETEILPELGCVPNAVDPGNYSSWSSRLDATDVNAAAEAINNTSREGNPSSNPGPNTSHSDPSPNRSPGSNQQHTYPNPNPNPNPNLYTPPSYSSTQITTQPDKSVGAASPSNPNLNPSCNITAWSSGLDNGCKYRQARLCAVDNRHLFGILDRDRASVGDMGLI